MSISSRRPFATALPRLSAAAVAAALCASGVALAGAASAEAPAGSVPTSTAGTAGTPSMSRSCPPDATALGYSDALDKAKRFGQDVGGLSGMVKDTRRGAYAAIEDHQNDGTPATVWFFTNPVVPRVVGRLTLRDRHGTPFNGNNFDGEGITVLPNGNYAVSSETEPSVRIFGRSGLELHELRVPARFRVAPRGQATSNATLEGLTISPDGKHIYATMEGTLSGDIARSGNDGYRRILDYTRTPHGYRLTKQIGYHVGPGMRISEAQAYGADSLLVMEAAYDPSTGNTIRLYSVHDLSAAKDVSTVADLGNHAALVAPKQLAVNVTRCPTLGATSPEPQANPLMDNYEAMSIRPPLAGSTTSRVLLLSDDNFSTGQVTRLLRLAVPLG